MALFQSMDEMKSLHEQHGSDPAKALKLWFDALFLYLDESTRNLGREAMQYLMIPYKKQPKWDTAPSNWTFTSRLKDAKHHHIFRSYAVGTSPENAYSMDPNNWELNVEDSKEDPHGRGWNVLLRSSGADNARPVYMKKSTKTGLYYINIHGNIYVGVRPPKDPDEEEFV